MFRNLFRSTPRAARGVMTPADTAVYVIGDIHGRADLLEELHEKICHDAAGRNVSRKVVVYLGDYVDRGDHSREVIDILIKVRLPDFQSVFLKGNHEDAMLRFLTDKSVGPSWMSFGGDATLMSYGVDPLSAGRDSPDKLGSMQALLTENLPAEHLRFLESLVLTHSEGGYFFVHAGVKPGVPLDEQSADDMMWIRDEFLDSTQDFGQVVVHGHSIRRKPEFRANRIGIDTGAVFTNVLTCLVLCGAARDVLQTS